ncbi:Inner nuclear membrane protein Man1 [Aphelenchoides besseyi]|nr:Inner nuclear membrane protein Man1 [Aphelenchoides besseyi]
MKAPSELTPSELRDELAQHGYKVGPVVDSTRPMYEKKLLAFRSGDSAKKSPTASNRSRRASPRQTQQSVFDTSNNTPPATRTRRDSPRQSPTVVNSTDSSPARTRRASPRQSPTVNSTDNSPSTVRSRLDHSRQSTLTADSTSSTYAKKLPSFRSGETSSTDSSPTYARFRRAAPRQSALYANSTLPSYSSTKMTSFRSIGTPKESTPTSVRSPRSRAVEACKRARDGDVAKIFMFCFLSFTLVLLIAYLSTAHPKTVERGRRIFVGAIYDTATFFYNYAVFPVFVLLIVAVMCFVPFYFYKTRRIRREKFERQTMELVDRIADRVRDSGSMGIAEQHIRDALIPPTRRTENDWTLWNSAVDFINNVDSRMLAENRVIGGVECNVWVWANAHDLSQGYSGIAERSPQPQRVPDHALTHCLKIRGLIDSNRSEDEIVKKEVYDKLRPSVPSHFSIVRGNESCVYVMFKNLEDAKRAFDAFHTQWIRGNLVSVKYVRDERYAERFPEVVM